METNRTRKELIDSVAYEYATFEYKVANGLYGYPAGGTPQPFDREFVFNHIKRLEGKERANKTVTTRFYNEAATRLSYFRRLVADFPEQI